MHIAHEKKGALGLDSKGRFRKRGEESAPSVDRLVWLAAFFGGIIGFTAIAAELRTSLSSSSDWDNGTRLAFGALASFAAWNITYHLSIEYRAKRALRYVCSVMFVPFVLLLLLIPKWTRDIVSPHLHHSILFGWAAAFSRAHTLTSRVTQAVALGIFVHGVNFYGSADLNFFDQTKRYVFDTSACITRFKTRILTDVDTCGTCYDGKPWNVHTCGTDHEHCMASDDGSFTLNSLRRTGTTCRACNTTHAGAPLYRADWFGRCDQCTLERHSEFVVPCRSYTLDEANLYLSLVCVAMVLGLGLSGAFHTWFVRASFPKLLPSALHTRKDIIFADAAQTALTWLSRTKDGSEDAFPYPIGSEKKKPGEKPWRKASGAPASDSDSDDEHVPPVPAMAGSPNRPTAQRNGHSSDPENPPISPRLLASGREASREDVESDSDLASDAGNAATSGRSEDPGRLVRITSHPPSSISPQSQNTQLSPSGLDPLVQD